MSDSEAKDPPTQEGDTEKEKEETEKEKEAGKEDEKEQVGPMCNWTEIGRRAWRAGPSRYCFEHYKLKKF